MSFSFQFSQNKRLYNILVDTHPKTLVEASPLDRIWGIGLSADDYRAKSRKTWRGKNLLGEALTEVRNEFIKKEKSGMNCKTDENRCAGKAQPGKTYDTISNSVVNQTE